jgi:hypothetical protein
MGDIIASLHQTYWIWLYLVNTVLPGLDDSDVESLQAQIKMENAGRKKNANKEKNGTDL